MSRYSQNHVPAERPTPPFLRYPIAVMSFDRPDYLELTLQSLKAQTISTPSSQIYLFQDGYRSRNGRDLTDPRRVERCMVIFETIFPGGKIFSSNENLGVGFNFARAERHLFEDLGAEVGFFFEDDLVLSPHYLTALSALAKVALEDKRIAYVAAYGDHRASLAEQRLSATKLMPMRHKWGFALTRRQWLAQRDIVGPYLGILEGADYRERNHAAIREYFKKLGYGSSGTSQDGMKDVASCILGTVKIMSCACFGKYIGEIGLHSSPRLFRSERYAQTVLYPDEIPSFELPSTEILERWVAATRAEGIKALGAMEPDSDQPRPMSALNLRNPSPGWSAPRISSEDFVRALYRVFLLREPDPTGLSSAIHQLNTGKSVEDLIRWCLESDEFADNQERFIRTYVSRRFRRSPEEPRTGNDQVVQETGV